MVKVIYIYVFLHPPFYRYCLKVSYLPLTLALTPAEILAQGPEAYQLYKQAIAEGKKAIHRTRLMLVGQERVGKTSLMKTLINQK